MEDKSTGQGIIRAAGGLLWREGPRGRELAIIHRPRYDDWALPKGKLRAGEDWSEAALREVGEETGCQAQLGAYAGTVTYTVDGVPKEVRFWHMTLRQEGRLTPSEEVDQVIWLTPQAALERLDYAVERTLVEEVGGR